MVERTEWMVDRREAVARGGMVAAKWGAAAEVGVDVLRRGGNAFDAAVATAFAVGVVEPWMSGIGGGGYLVGKAVGQAPFAVEFPMVAPRRATPALFPLSPGRSADDFFGWAGVVDQANVVGHRAVAVPGVVAGLALTLERWGTMPLAEVLAPAIRLAADGVPVTWHTTFKIAQAMPTLRRFPATAAVFLDAAGNPPTTLDQEFPAVFRQPDLARTLESIARDGPRAFYEGPLARAMTAHLAERGAPFDERDFGSYEPTVTETIAARYGGYAVHTVGGGTGGTTLVESLNLMTALGTARFGHNTPDALHRLTQAFRQAFADRFAYLADPAFVDVPVAALTDPAYAAEQAAPLPANRHGSIRPGDPARLGVGHGLPPSMRAYVDAFAGTEQATDGSTTHLCVVDAAGNAVSLTQTLLSLFGSRVVVPGTGVLLNNGMMWFDPEPGRPNSVAGGKRPLSNMAPALIVRGGDGGGDGDAPAGGKVVAAIGSSGGRLIMNCHAQLVANLLDHDLSMQPAISAPRIDASEPELVASDRIDPATLDALRRRGHRVGTRNERLFTGDFASPAGIQRSDDGELRGGVDPYYFPAAAVGVGSATRRDAHNGSTETNRQERR